MTVEEGTERTVRYERDGIHCVWITPRHAPWLCALPSCHVTDEDGELVVVRGHAKLDPKTACWLPGSPTAFPRIARGLLNGRITTTNPTGVSETIGDYISYYPYDCCFLVSTSDFEAWYPGWAAQERREREHAANLAALCQRQDRVLQLAIGDAADAIEPGGILLGVPPAPWDGAMPVDRVRARGSDATGGGAAIWAAESAPGRGRRLWAVVCPVASKTTPNLGRSWQRRGVRVYTETRKEADRLAAALGWDAAQLVVRGPDVPGELAGAGHR